MREWTIEDLTAFLNYANVKLDGYGEQNGETVEQHRARVEREAAGFDPLDFIPVQDLVKEAI